MSLSDSLGDESIEQAVIRLTESVNKIEDLLRVGLDCEEKYKEYDLKDKISYDLFIGYTLNTLYWVYLRTQGVDPNQNEVKAELNRIRDYMLKAKEAKEKELRPRIQQDAAKRFVKHGMGLSIRDSNDEPAAKKTKMN